MAEKLVKCTLPDEFRCAPKADLLTAIGCGLVLGIKLTRTQS